jgi:HlyD family secretion protein
MKRIIIRTVVGLLALGLIGAGAVWYLQRREGKVPSYRTAQVTRGDLKVSISATGTLQPEEVVDVGAQVAGQIVSFGQDLKGKTVDYGSVVEKGTVLARIDDSLYLAEAAQAEAQVRAAKSSIQRAEADLEQLRAKFRQAERDWERAQKIEASKVLAQASYDAYKSAYETAKANVAVGEAAILQARDGLAQAEAVLRRAQRNLGYCTIRSPVRGVIIDRRVNIGQTVVASLNAPSLFLIAKDLTRMQVWVAVNEADIGKILPGQPVTYTVDAFPGETFRGKVGKVRLNASMTQNVVTYTVEITTENPEGRLLPYLTANVQFELDRISNALLVPRSALRWRPSADQVAPQFREAFEATASRKQRPEGASRPQAASAKASEQIEGSGVLWVLEGAFVRPLPVRVGLNDGTTAAVEGEGVNEGLKVVTGVAAEAGGREDTSNPFTPQFGRGSRPSGSR